MNLHEMGFQFAFTVENYLDRKVRDDPAYVKFIVLVINEKEGVVSEKLLSYHKCNETDWEHFAPASRRSKTKFEAIRDTPDRGFYCVDWPEDGSTFVVGDYSTANIQYIEINLVPC